MRSESLPVPHFLERNTESLGLVLIQYNISSQPDGHSEDHSDIGNMLRACALNGQHLRAFLYGKKCRDTYLPDEVGERLIEGPELIENSNEKGLLLRRDLKRG
ncbi:hypothetical protein Tco_0706114 [Tanacetum coccineum]|uniref:Uncharacterized protein n=1 Tax=Tanacetum coccineum TaxID=301880 RepID=A0ABQ4Y6H0_9ASTR